MMRLQSCAFCLMWRERRGGKFISKETSAEGADQRLEQSLAAKDWTDSRLSIREAVWGVPDTTTIVKLG